MVSKQTMAEILVIVIMFMMFVSGFLFASGLLLSWPRNPLWIVPSLVVLIQAFLIALYRDKIRKEEP